MTGNPKSATELFLSGKTKEELISIIMKERAYLKEVLEE